MCHYLNMIRCDCFLGNFVGKFGYFLFLHLVTLVRLHNLAILFSDFLRRHLHRRPLRQHPRHLRRAQVLQDADRHLHLHPDAGSSRRDLPHRDTLPHRDVCPRGLDLRHGHVQDLPDYHIHQSGTNAIKTILLEQMVLKIKAII